MRSSIAISIAALAGSALAAPSYPAAYPAAYPADQPAPAANPNVEVVVEHVVHTVYVTEGSPEATPCPSSTPAATPAPAATPSPEAYPAEQPAPAPSTFSSVVYVEATPSPYPEAPVEPEPTPTPTPAPAPEPTPTPTPSPSPSPAPSTGGYMDVVAEWRAKLGLSALEFSAELESNALDVVIEGNGKMVHKLNKGTFGQVLAPGDADKFEYVFVGGWLCEMANLPGLGDACAQFSKGWDYQGQTGHAEILTSPNYSKIGCSNREGIWCCDLA